MWQICPDDEQDFLEKRKKSVLDLLSHGLFGDRRKEIP